VDLALELTSALHTYAFLRMRDEIFTWTEAAVAMDGAHAHPLYAVAAGSLALGLALRWDLERAEMYARTGLAANGSTIEALDALAVVALERGDLSSAIRWAKDLEREATAAGDDYFLAFSHLTRFVAHLEDDDRVAAGVHQRRFAELAFDLGNPTLMAWAHLSEGEFLLAEDVASASRLFDDAIAMGSSVGNDLVVGLALSAMATSHAEQGLVPAAISVFVQTVEHWLERADWAHQFATLRSVVSFLGRIGQTEFAAELLGAVRQGYADLTPAGSAMAQLTDSAASLEASLGRERFRRLVASGRRLTRHETVALAQRALGEASADLGMDPEVAVLANLVHLSDADRTLSLHRA
ncbi:MAG: hypothetical protein HKN07_07895, partial [Acidimicrobiia bacterium]|nr:hypothetical protein [Acidimicrobiia bacterium]